jgi:tol-pal system protein YbgF
MPNNRTKGFFALASALLLTGCVATQRDILDLSQQTDSMTLKINSLKSVMKTIQANQADLDTRLDDLHRDVSILNENLKDNSDTMMRLGSKMDDLGAALGMKVQSLDNSISKTQEIIAKTEADRVKREERRRIESERKRKADAAKKAAEAERKAAEAEAAKLAAEKRAKELAAAGPTPSELYRQAKKNYDNKEYELAAKGFALYVERFPKGSLVEDSIYLWGNCFYAEGDFESAARKYATLLDRYPKSDLTPASRMRYALSLLKLKTHLDEARRYLESIPEDFPNSPEAKRAAKLLEDWDAKKRG